MNTPKRVTAKYLQSVLIEINRKNGLPDGEHYERNDKGEFTTKEGTLVLNAAYGGYQVAEISSDGGTSQRHITYGFDTARNTLNALRAKLLNF